MSVMVDEMDLLAPFWMGCVAADNQLIARLRPLAGGDIVGDHWARYTFQHSRLVVPVPGGAQGART
jgi:hypothetical protein